MFDSLHIQGFRALEDLRLNGLGAVNLLVGKNNVGKTTVLEAIKMRCAGTSAVWEIEPLLKSHQEIKRARSKEGETRQQYDLNRLFYCPSNGTDQPASRRLSIGPVDTPDSTLTLEFGLVGQVTLGSSDRELLVVDDVSPIDKDQEPFEAIIIKFGRDYGRRYTPDNIFHSERNPYFSEELGHIDSRPARKLGWKQCG